MAGMDRLLDQLFAALDDLERRNSRDSYNAVWWGMLWFGGVGKYATVGKVAAPPAGTKDKRSLGEVRGHYTLEHLKHRMTTLVDGRERLHEPFVVVSFVRGIEEALEHSLATYGKGKAKLREDYEFFQRLADDTEERALYNERVRMRRAKVKDGAPGVDDLTGEAAQHMADFLKRESVASLTDMRERQQSLDMWRELTGPIVDRENVHRYLEQQLVGDLDD